MVVLTNEGASSSSSTCRWKYDVFLSFRGEDTRTGFTTYLYKALEQKGINTFMDDKLSRGEEISAELLKTIEESMILVIVFSKNYAESKWCLDELVKIVECSENDQMVLRRPIFYNVEPREVRNQLGNFGIALANHEKEFKDNMGKMPRWREALSKAANLSGSHYEEGKDYVVKILDACDLYPDFGIGRLIDKCLITVEHGTLWMHDLLQQMGREIVQEESEGLENRSRIWCREDANKLLTRNKGSDKIRGIMWREPKPITVSLKASAFKKMENLKVLIVKNVQNSKKLKYLSNELRWFEWLGYNFSLPSKFCPQKLVGLEVSNSCIKLAKLFKQVCDYKYLKHINLERCQSITRLPDLCAPNLERLIISYCENLIEIHDTIGLLDKLECLFLGHCMKLQILPSTLKLNKRFVLWKCPRLEKFPNVHPETKCLGGYTVADSNIREWPLSLRYLTEGIIKLEIWRCENRGKFLDSTNKLQLLEETNTNSFVINPDECGDLKLQCCGEILIDLDFFMKNDFFPALRYVTIEHSNIVSIPEGIFRLSRLEAIYIGNCKELREIQIPRLPQSIRRVIMEKCPSLLPQSSSRLLNQFGKILGILPNRVREGARSDILMDLFDDSESQSESVSDSETEEYLILLPGTEIPKSLKFNHQSFGNSISFKVGCKFPKLAVCVAFPKFPYRIGRRYFKVHVSVNVNLKIYGWKYCKQYFNHDSTEESYEELWLFSKSLGKLDELNLSEQNQVEVEVLCKIQDRNFELVNHNDSVKWLGVNVECICCPQKSDITYLPLPSDRNGCGSSSVLNDTELPPFQPVFPISNGFEPGLKGFLGDLNLSLAAPNNSELLALLPGPNMDHEVSNTVNDLRLLKGIHNDGCDLSLSLNDSNERESEPPLFPDLTNGFGLGFAQPNLELGSGVSSGFHLGSSSMAHASVNDDSDFYKGSSSMAHDCLNDDSDFNMGPPPKKARTS